MITTEQSLGKDRASHDPQVRRPAINGAVLRRMKPTGRGVWVGGIDDKDGCSHFTSMPPPSPRTIAEGEMDRTTQHRITVCTSCRHKGSDCRPGYELIEKLRTAITAAGDSISEDFAISGVACMAGCDRPCTVAYHGTQKATYLFGDITPEDDIADLVDFARQYAVLHDGWCSSVDRPGKLRKTTLARVPAAMIAIQDTKALVS